jgi:hypothetical protein
VGKLSLSKGMVMNNFNILLQEDSSDIIFNINRYIFKLNVNELQQLIMDLNKIKIQIINKNKNNKIDI